MGERPPVDPAEVQATIEYLDTRTDKDFAEALADCIMDPDPVEIAAFRSPHLAARSFAATRYLIDHANTTIEYRRADDEVTANELRRATARFRDRVGLERNLLANIVRGDRSRRGLPDNAPNARARAMRRLKQRHLAEYQALTREEQARIDAEEAERRAIKAQEQAARRAARNGARGAARRG